MFTKKKLAVRLSALVLVAVTGAGLVAIEGGSAAGSVEANWPHCC